MIYEVRNTVGGVRRPFCPFQRVTRLEACLLRRATPLEHHYSELHASLARLMRHVPGRATHGLHEKKSFASIFHLQLFGNML